MEIIGTIIGIAFVAVLLHLKWRFTYWTRRNVFALPPSLPFGNAKDLFLATAPLVFSVLPLYQEAKSRGLRYAGYYLFNQAYFVPIDVDLIRTMLVKDFQYFMDHGLIYINEDVDPLTGHLLAQRGVKWRALRAKLTPTFSSGKLKYMFQTLVDCTEDLPAVLDEAINNHESIDIKETFARYTTDVIGSCAFGIECNCLKNPNNEFRKYGRKIFEMSRPRRLRRLLTFVVPDLFRIFKIPTEDKEVERFFINLVKESIKFRDQAKTERKDFMQLLMELKHHEFKTDVKVGEENATPHSYYQNGLSVNEIAAQAFVFFAAGFETSSTTLTFLMYEIASHPDIQEKLREEIKEVLAKHGGKITYEAINEMVYLDQCFCEALRKYPAAPLSTRKCTKTYKVPNSNLVIEEGTEVLIPIYGVHHDPEYYPDPETFDPERFREENKSKRPAMAFLAFGEGPRICIGMRFGILQTKVGLVAMMKHFKFTLSPKTKHPFEYKPSPVLTVKEDIWVDAERIY